MLRNRLAACAAAAAMCLAPAAGTAAAAPDPPDAPRSMLLLTIARGDQDRNEASQVMLLCQPPGGTHPRAGAACGQLAAVNGNVAALDRKPAQPCILIYYPVTVTATGTWEGKAVNYQGTFGNSCRLNAAKGALFQF